MAGDGFVNAVVFVNVVLCLKIFFNALIQVTSYF